MKDDKDLKEPLLFRPKKMGGLKRINKKLSEPELLVSTKVKLRQMRELGAANPIVKEPVISGASGAAERYLRF